MSGLQQSAAHAAGSIAASRKPSRRAAAGRGWRAAAAAAVQAVGSGQLACRQRANGGFAVGTAAPAANKPGRATAAGRQAAAPAGYLLARLQRGSVLAASMAPPGRHGVGHTSAWSALGSRSRWQRGACRSVMGDGQQMPPLQRRTQPHKAFPLAAGGAGSRGAAACGLLEGRAACKPPVSAARSLTGSSSRQLPAGSGSGCQHAAALEAPRLAASRRSRRRCCPHAPPLWCHPMPGGHALGPWPRPTAVAHPSLPPRPLPQPAPRPPAAPPPLPPRPPPTTPPSMWATWTAT